MTINIRMRLSNCTGWSHARRFTSAVVTAISLSATGFAQREIFVGSGQHAKFSSANATAFEDLKRGTALAAGSRVRTAADGRADLVWGNAASLQLLARGELAIGNVRPESPISSATGFTPADSALKSVLTKSDTSVPTARTQPANATLTLSSGILLGSVTQAMLRVNFGKGEFTASRASFSISTGPSDCARLTVDSGEVTVVPSGGRALAVYAGQFVKLCAEGPSIAVTGPMPAESDAAARRDLAAVRMASTGDLAPIGEYTDGKMALDGKTPLPAVGEGPKTLDPPGAVGIAPSIPFDLRGVILPLLIPANPPNILPPINSPERP